MAYHLLRTTPIRTPVQIVQQGCAFLHAFKMSSHHPFLLLITQLKSDVQVVEAPVSQLTVRCQPSSRQDERMPLDGEHLDGVLLDDVVFLGRIRAGWSGAMVRRDDLGWEGDPSVGM